MYMKVVIVSKAFVMGAYQRKAEEIAKHGVDLTVLAPPEWEDSRGRQQVERAYTNGYTLRTIPIVFNGHFHTHFYPTLLSELTDLQPDVLHMDEEPYNMATWLALRAAKWRNIPATFFTWQNILKKYPPPFLFFERDIYKLAPIAIAGNAAAHSVLQAKGYSGDIAVIPQFGVDTELFRASSSGKELASPTDTVRIGYAGGLLPEKGIDLLLRACAKLKGDWSLSLIGTGEILPELEDLAIELDIQKHVYFIGRVDSILMPERYRELDILVLPSRTTENWIEQFGRVLTEAMASEVVVIGSDSGEIPNVIADAGIIFAQGDSEHLCIQLQTLLDQPELRHSLAKAGRQRVLDNYTMKQIAANTVDVYERLTTLRT